MPDNKTIRRPEDAERIDIHDPAEVRNWCKALDVDKPTLEAAVRAVGTYAHAVRRFLGK